MKRIHVVFGAAGGLGSAIARRLVADGQTVRAVVRDVDRAHRVLPEQAGIEVADATDVASARHAARDATAVYQCAGLSVADSETLLPRITRNVASAAHQADAVLVLPSNVSVYGPLDKTPVDEAHPLAATSRAGQIRSRVETELLDEDRAGRLRVVIPRLADLYGPNVTSQVTLSIFRAALSEVAASWPGRSDVPHDLLFVDDAAAACVLLAEANDAHGQAWHIPGPGPVTGKHFIEMVFAAAGTESRVETVGQDALKYSGAAMSETSELMEVMYLYEGPMVLNGRKFARAFGGFRYTPHTKAIARTIEWLSEHMDR